MELREVVDRYAEALEHVDVAATTRNANRRTGELYLPGVKSLTEVQAVEAIDATWRVLRPDELVGRLSPRVSAPYPTLSRAACDHVFTTATATPGADHEWGVEVKKIELFGENGKVNDHGVGKMLSPYLKDRGLLHDALRLRDHGFTRRVAVIGYSFDYDLATCDKALDLHPDSAQTIQQVRNVLKDGPLSARPLVVFADAILNLRGLLRGPRADASFTAWRHPVGGHGYVWGWEVRRPHLEPGYDPRHPW